MSALASTAAGLIRADDPGGWKKERRDLMRAIAGGAIVGMPLLYTMEMWWHGMTLSPWHLIGLLCGILGANFVFSLISGFRAGSSPSVAVGEAITSVGIGVVLSTCILLLIGELETRDSLTVSLSKILLEATAVSIGVSFANSQFEGRSRTGEEGENGGEQKPDDPEKAQVQADLEDAAATLAGSTVFALNMAPTEEVLLIATRLSPWHLLGMLAGAAVLCYVILFASGFEKHRVHVQSLFQHPVSETVMNVALSLLVALVLLLMLGQREVLASPATLLAATVTLGLPAVVGGAAGRLIA